MSGDLFAAVGELLLTAALSVLLVVLGTLTLVTAALGAAGLL